MSQTLTPYKPSLREKLAYLLAGGAERLGADINTQRAIIGKAKDAIDFVPGVGDAVGFNEAGRDIQAGNYGAGAMGMGLATLGLLPGAGDMASKVGKKVINSAENVPELIKLYHGTNKEGYDSIINSGLWPRTFFSPSRSNAETYAYNVGGGDDTVIEAMTTPDNLEIDFDLPGAKTLNLEEANSYTGNDSWTIHDYIKNGQSVSAINPNLVEIIKKYGVAGASAMLGYNILGGLSDAQAGGLNADAEFNKQKSGGAMPDLARLEQALRNADAVGDVNAAKVFAAEIRKMQGQSAPASQPQQEQSGGFLQTVDDAVRGAANGLTFGLADRFAGYMGGEGTDAERAKSAQAQERSPIAYTGGEIGGAVAGLGKLQGMGLTTAGLLPKGAGLLGKMGAGVADSLVINEAMNAGYGRDFGDNAGLAAIAGGAAPAIGQGVSALGSKALGMFNKAPATMDAEALKQAAQAAYSRADDAGVIYSPDAVKRVADSLKGEFADFGYHPELQSGAKVALGELDRISQGNVTLKGLDTARKIAGNAYQPMNKSNNALTAKVSGAIDDLVQNPQAGDVVMGDASKASAAIKEARDLYGRSAKLDKVNYLLKKAGLQAGSTGSGGNIENATRQQLKTLLTNPKNTRGFTPDERAALEKAVLGTPVQNALRLAGKLSPQGNGLMAALGVGGAATVPAVAVPAMAGGFLAKKGAERMTQSNVKALEKLIASGGNAAAVQAPKNAAQKALEAKKDLIAKMLLGGSLVAMPAN